LLLSSLTRVSRMRLLGAVANEALPAMFPRADASACHASVGARRPRVDVTGCRRGEGNALYASADEYEKPGERDKVVPNAMPRSTLASRSSIRARARGIDPSAPPADPC
jgi:hypothetical protein